MPSNAKAGQSCNSKRVRFLNLEKSLWIYGPESKFYSFSQAWNSQKGGREKVAYGAYLPCFHRDATNCNVLLWASNASTQTFSALRLIIYKYSRITVSSVCLNRSLSSQLPVEWIMRTIPLIRLITLRRLVVLCFFRFLSWLSEVFTTFSALGISITLISFVI